VAGLPAYSANGQAASAPIAYAPLPGGGGTERLVLSGGSAAGTLHYALITNGSTGVTAAQRAAVHQELATWVAGQLFPVS
jgi:hypothetical protein